MLLRMGSASIHVSVLLESVLEHLCLRAGACCVDATLDGGGHAAAILDATAPDGLLLGIDRDAELLEIARARLSGQLACGRLRVVCANFRELDRVLKQQDFPLLDAILFDLGISSFHLDASGRGFSYSRGEPLDMRFDPLDASRETAARILSTRSGSELTRIFRELGEERFASRIARTIVARRRLAPLTTSGELVDAITASLPPNLRWRATRHAARVFQALRIAVNDELGALAEALPQAAAALAPRGRLAVIAFHSLEDRIVKVFLRDEKRAGRLRVLTARPIRPSPEEVAANPRAASARLRVAERI